MKVTVYFEPLELDIDIPGEDLNCEVNKYWEIEGLPIRIEGVIKRD